MIRFIWCGLMLVVCFHLHGQKDSTLELEVHFALDSYSMQKAERVKIDSVLSLAPVSVLKRIEIYGHTDSLAGEAYNQELSKRRVQDILQYLVYKGVDPLNVNTDHYGEAKPKYDNGPGERYKNRRVELTLVIDPALLPPPEQKLTDLEFKTGSKIRIPDLNFVGNQPIPVWQSFSALGELLTVMRQNPDLKIELQGHVCCGDDYELSVQRAFMVYDFLQSNGVDKSRLSYKGFSNSKPLFPERTDKEKALNRRVEVLVIKNTDKRERGEEEKATIDVRARVLNVKFFPHKGKLYPSGDFMVSLIAEMMRDSQGLFYEFVIFDNINDKQLTALRASALKRKIQDMRVKSDMFIVRTMSKPGGMPASVNDNYITVRIQQK